MSPAFLFQITAAMLLLAPASAAPGDPDLSFGNGGGFLMDLSAGHDVAQAMALQVDGKVLLAGHAAPNNFTMLRLLPDGSLDTAFGTGGRFTHKFGSFESAIGVAVQKSGKIVLGGAGLVRGVSRDFAVVRCLENGTLDPSFGTEGTTTTDLKADWGEQAYAMALGADDRILLGGSHRSDFAMVRYLPDGGLDPSFGDEGKVFTFATSVRNQEIHALAIMGDGRIVAAGIAFGNNNTDVVVARYSSNGQPDASFGTAGRTYSAVGEGNTSDEAHAVAVLADGKILAAGTSGGKFLLQRYTAGGLLDPSFGTGGNVTIGFPGFSQKGTGLVVQPDGGIIVTGTLIAARHYFAAIRFNADGGVDSTFGNGGGLVTALTDGSDNAGAALLQPDGKLLVAGSAGLEGNQAMAVIRYEMSGFLPLTQWRKKHFGSEDNSGMAANTYDADGDGLINLLEYAFGQIPTQAGSCAVPEGKLIGGNFVSTFTAPSTVTGITYAAEWSPALAAGTWMPMANTGSGRVHTFSVAVTSPAEFFLRWKISAP